MVLQALKEVYSGPDLRFRVGSLQPGQQYAARLQVNPSQDFPTALSTAYVISMNGMLLPGMNILVDRGT